MLSRPLEIFHSETPTETNQTCAQSRIIWTHFSNSGLFQNFRKNTIPSFSFHPRRSIQLPQHQFGFWEKHNSSTSQSRYFIASSFKQKHYISGVFLDIRQAFNEVWHPGFLLKLKTIRLSTHYIKLQSFLSYRHFSVSENSYRSKPHQINAGVLQGTILSSILCI